MTHRSLPSAMPSTNLTPGHPTALVRAMELRHGTAALIRAIELPLSSMSWCGSLVRAVVRVVRLAQSGKAPG